MLKHWSRIGRNSTGWCKVPRVVPLSPSVPAITGVSARMKPPMGRDSSVNILLGADRYPGRYNDTHIRQGLKRYNYGNTQALEPDRAASWVRLAPVRRYCARCPHTGTRSCRLRSESSLCSQTDSFIRAESRTKQCMDSCARVSGVKTKQYSVKLCLVARLKPDITQLVLINSSILI